MLGKLSLINYTGPGCQSKIGLSSEPIPYLIFSNVVYLRNQMRTVVGNHHPSNSITHLCFFLLHGKSENWKAGLMNVSSQPFRGNTANFSPREWQQKGNYLVSNCPKLIFQVPQSFSSSLLLKCHKKKGQADGHWIGKEPSCMFCECDSFELYILYIYTFRYIFTVFVWSTCALNNFFIILKIAGSITTIFPNKTVNRIIHLHGNTSYHTYNAVLLVHSQIL